MKIKKIIDELTDLIWRVSHDEHDIEWDKCEKNAKCFLANNIIPLLEKEKNDNLFKCPFCGEEIDIFIGDPCGSETNGYTSINHFCDSGLSIEYFEHGRDYDKAKKALSKIICLGIEKNLL